MLHRRLIPAVMVMVLLGMVSVSHAQDAKAVTSQDDANLRAVVTAAINALNSRSVDAAVAPVLDNVVVYGIFSPFPIEGKESYRQAVQEYFDRYQRGEVKPIDPQYKVIGLTGVAWGNFRIVAQRKNGSAESSDGRYLFTLTQMNGRWLILSMHYSLLQPLVK